MRRINVAISMIDLIARQGIIHATLGFTAAAFKAKGISVVLSGGSCVSIYSGDRYVAMDLDFVNAAVTSNGRPSSCARGRRA